MITRRREPKLQPEWIDTTLLAIAPVLIIGMVASLIFFLVVAFYRGEYDGRLMYILGLYTMAVVLIARIAIESGRGYANLFSVPLAIVSMLAMMKFVTVSGPLGGLSWLVNIGLLGVAWYLADRITFDCAWVDRRHRVVQQGLLQSLGLMRRDENFRKVFQPTDSADGRQDDAATRRMKKQAAAGDAPKKVKQRKHNPGVWVLYFSLLAFPLFGLGQLTIPDRDVRQSAFYYLVSYLAFSLSLLLTTSLLSLRRYLRQRGVRPPGEVNRSWLAYGIGGLAVLLLISLVLPLPGRSHGLVDLPVELREADWVRPSQWGWGEEQVDPRDDTESGERRVASSEGRGEEQVDPQDDGTEGSESRPAATDAAGEPPDQDSEDGAGRTCAESSDASQDSGASTSDRPSNQQSSNQQSSPRQGENRQPEGSPDAADPDQDANDQDASEQDASEAADSETNGANRSDRSEPSDSDADGAAGRESPPSSQDSTGSSWSLPTFPTGSFAEFFKWLTILVLVLIILVYALTHPREIAKLLSALRSWLAGLLGGRDRKSSPAAQANVQSPGNTSADRRSFHDFPNPFRQQLQGWSPAEVVTHTFAALEAWAGEHGAGRENDQTASEFAKFLARREPRLREQAPQAAKMLDQVMFAGWQPGLQDLDPLAELWRQLERG